MVINCDDLNVSQCNLDMLKTDGSVPTMNLFKQVLKPGHVSQTTCFYFMSSGDSVLFFIQSVEFRICHLSDFIENQSNPFCTDFRIELFTLIDGLNQEMFLQNRSKTPIFTEANQGLVADVCKRRKR